MSVESEPAGSVESEPETEADKLALSVVAVLSPSSPLPSVPPNRSSSLTSPEPSTEEATGNETKNRKVLLLRNDPVQTMRNYLKCL